MTQINAERATIVNFSDSNLKMSEIISDASSAVNFSWTSWFHAEIIEFPSQYKLEYVQMMKSNKKN